MAIVGARTNLTVDAVRLVHAGAAVQWWPVLTVEYLNFQHPEEIP
jgi:hypothetical protein